MSSSWLKVSCVALGMALGLSTASAVAAPATHSSSVQNGLAATSPIIVFPNKLVKSPIIVFPNRLAKSPIIVFPNRAQTDHRVPEQAAQSPIIVFPIGS